MPRVANNVFNESIYNFVKAITRFLQDTVLDAKGGIQIYSLQLNENFKDVTEKGLRQFFKKHPDAEISRVAQIKITKNIMKEIKDDIEKHGRILLNPEKVTEIIKKIVCQPGQVKKNHSSFKFASQSQPANQVADTKDEISALGLTSRHKKTS